MIARRGISLARALVFALALPVVLVALWWLLSANSTNYYLPPLSKIVGAFGDTWFHGRLTGDVLPSILRLLVGFLLALVLGVAFGVLIGSFRTVRALVEPVLEFLRALPPPVLVPILMLFAGIGTTMKLLVIVSGCVWPILLNTVEGVRALDPVLDETSRSYGIRGVARLRRLVIPAASPQIITGMRQALSIGIILMVISEMFASSNGLGFTIIQFQRSFAVTPMWTGIILLGILGYLLALVMRVVERRALYWYFGARRAQRGGS